jgi:hypothetical protein
MLVAATLFLVSCAGDGTRGSTSGSSTATTEPPPTAAEVAFGLCEATAVLSDPVPAVQSTALTELSGLVASRRAAGVWWAHNDSGHEGRLHVVGPNGEDGGSVAVKGAASVDWEDLAVGPGPDGDLLYIADIGNNIGDRDTVPIEVVAEPDTAGGLPPSIRVERSIELTWPDGARDAEVLLVDPQSSQLVIVTKSFAGPSEVYTADGTGSGPTEMTKVGTVDLRAAAAVPSDDAPVDAILGLGASTGGDVTAAGDVALIRTYGTALVWPREDGQSLAEAIVENEPCEAPTAAEPQGEAIAVDPDGRGYRTISEGGHPPINRFASAP